MLTAGDLLQVKGKICVIGFAVNVADRSRAVGRKLKFYLLIDRRGQNKTIVIICVLPNYIDPAGGMNGKLRFEIPEARGNIAIVLFFQKMKFSYSKIINVKFTLIFNIQKKWFFCS